MPSSRSTSPPLTEHDRSLIEKCEDAVREGLALERWCRTGGGDREEFRLDLGRSFRLPNRADGYFGTLTVNGTERSVMGCRQQIEFARIARRRDAEALLTQFVLGEFLSRAHWVYDDGAPGGFDVERSLYQTADGEHGKFPNDRRAGAMHWQDVGPRFRWVLLTIILNDFVLDLGPVTSRMAEAVCVVAMPEFVHVARNPSPEYALEVSIGYPFIDHAPIPNFFGFGPGKFGIAVKLYSFRLTHDNRIRVVMEFAAAPRAEKVFDIFGVDPVYGGVDLLHRMSLGLFDPQGIHDTMDTGMLVSHCHVHQKLMDGTSEVWEDWLAESTS
jgi:hypothetical protein